MNSYGRGLPIDRVLTPAEQALSMTSSSAFTGLRRARGEYPRWVWLGVALGVPGGILGYFLVHESNEDAARAILKTALVVQLVAWAAWLAYTGAQTAAATLHSNSLFALLS